MGRLPSLSGSSSSVSSLLAASASWAASAAAARPKLITIPAEGAGACGPVPAAAGRSFVVQTLSRSASGIPSNAANRGSLAKSSDRTDWGSTPNTTTEWLVARSAPLASSEGFTANLAPKLLLRRGRDECREVLHIVCGGHGRFVNELPHVAHHIQCSIRTLSLLEAVGPHDLVFLLVGIVIDVCLFWILHIAPGKRPAILAARRLFPFLRRG